MSVGFSYSLKTKHTHTKKKNQQHRNKQFFNGILLPTEVQKCPIGLRDVLVEPGQEVELGDCSRLVGLHVLQVEAPHQEVIAPDVFRHEVHLQGAREQPSALVLHAGDSVPQQQGGKVPFTS